MHYRSPGATREVAWVPIVEMRDMMESDGDLYPKGTVKREAGPLA